MILLIDSTMSLLAEDWVICLLLIVDTLGRRRFQIRSTFKIGGRRTVQLPQRRDTGVSAGLRLVLIIDVFCNPHPSLKNNHSLSPNWVFEDP